MEFFDLINFSNIFPRMRHLIENWYSSICHDFENEFILYFKFINIIMRSKKSH